MINKKNAFAQERLGDFFGKGGTHIRRRRQIRAGKLNFDPQDRFLSVAILSSVSMTTRTTAKSNNSSIT
jgi:hypothetical protein